MNENNIIHYDIKPLNITFIKNAFKYIDFGISSKTNNYKKIKNRALQELNTNRIYPYYPYEIIYLYANKIKLNLEKISSYRRYNNNIHCS